MYSPVYFKELKKKFMKDSFVSFFFGQMQSDFIKIVHKNYWFPAQCAVYETALHVWGN